MSHGHTLYVILPHARNVPPGGMAFEILPRVRLHITPEKGKTLKEALNIPPFVQYRRALNGHEIVIQPQELPRPNEPLWRWRAAITNNVNRSVCGVYGNAFVFHPPSVGLEEQAIKAILEHFQPDFEEPEQPPEWSTEVAARIPGVVEIDSRMARTLQEVADLNSRLTADESRGQELRRWAEMLWLSGVPLQRRVSEALAFLGVPNQSKNPTGHMEDLEGVCSGKPLLFEVTASSGSITVDKARQLLQWMGETDDPTNTKGILIANAYRNDPPDKRPPTPDHKIFVKEVEEMAQRFHFGLLDIREIFDLVVRKLAGEEISPEMVCQGLQGDGKLTFPKR
jgi:hypothetical protein